MKIGDEVAWTLPETGKKQSGVIVSIDRWTHQPHHEIRDYKIKKDNGELAFICCADVKYVNLHVAKSRVQNTPR